MTRRDCEDRLLELAEEMERVYSTFDPAGKKLFVTISEGRINIEDERTADCFGPDEKVSIRLFRSSKGEVARTFFWTQIFKRREVTA